MAAISSTAILASMAASQAASSISQGMAQSSAQKANANYQRNISEMNAKMAELAGRDAVRRGTREAGLVRRAGKQALGAQRAAAAAQGIEVDSGSALELQSDTRLYNKLDAMTVKNNAWREAWGYKVQALNTRGEGEQLSLASKAAAKNTILTSGFNAVSYGAQAYAYGKGYGTTTKKD